MSDFHTQKPSSPLFTNGANRLHISSAGNVGIGTAPTQRLEVNGNIRCQQNLLMGANAISGVSTFVDGSAGTSYNAARTLTVRFGSSNVESVNSNQAYGFDIGNPTMNATIGTNLDFTRRVRLLGDIKAMTLTGGGNLLIGGTLPSSPNITLSAAGQISTSNTINAKNYSTLTKKRLYQDGDSTGSGTIAIGGLGVLAGGVHRGGIVKLSVATGQRGSPGGERQGAEFFITYSGSSTYSTTTITRTTGAASVTCAYDSSTSSAVLFDIGYTRTSSHWTLIEVEIVDTRGQECSASISTAF